MGFAPRKRLPRITHAGAANKKINTNTYEEKTTTERWKDFIKQNNINTDLVVINVEYRDLNTNSSRYYNVNRNKWSGSYNEAS